MPAAGDFETWELLGRNAYGSVYRGVQFSLKRDVAIFELDAPLRKEAEQAPRFWDEVTQIAQLTDDALVSVYAVDRKLGWIVMELTAGHCGQLLDRPQPPDVCRSILRQALMGLRTLHEAGRTHGDLRPPTLLIHRGGRIKLSFALGAAMIGGLPYQRREMKYVAPELISPTFGEFGPRADLYCLAFSVLELMVGPKFSTRFAGVSTDKDADNRTAWMRWHADENAKLPSVRELAPGAPEEFATVLDRMLSKRVADRPATAAEALAALAEAPLVPVLAPGVDLDEAAGGAALVGDVNKLLDPASRFEAASGEGRSSSSTDAKKADGGAANQKRKQVAAPGKATAANKGKKKSNLPAILVALAFVGLAAGIVIMDGSGSSDSTDPNAASSSALKFAALDPIKIPEDAIWSMQVQVADPSQAKGKLKYHIVSTSVPGPEMFPDGNLLWLPTEEHGPGEVKIEFEAADESTPPQIARGTLTLQVTEVNRIPALMVPVDPPVTAGSELRVTMKAEDPDLPPNNITFLLEGGPPGAAIDPKTGELTWTPPASTPASFVEVKIAVVDDGVPPETNRRSIAVAVKAGNKPPDIDAIAEQTVTLPYDAELGEPAVRLRMRATDPDDPGSLPRFALAEPAPAGAKLDARTGEFTLQPTSADALKPGKYPVTVEVFDQATPPASTKTEFQIVVKPAATSPAGP